MEQAGGAGELLNALGLWKEAVGGGVMDREAWRAAIHGVAKSWT